MTPYPEKTEQTIPYEFEGGHDVVTFRCPDCKTEIAWDGQAAKAWCRCNYEWVVIVAPRIYVTGTSSPWRGGRVT